MQAIVTKYVGDTAHKPARYKATSASRLSTTVSAEAVGAAIDGHRAAVAALCVKLDWHGVLYGGALDDRGTMVWVFWEPDDDQIERMKSLSV